MPLVDIELVPPPRAWQAQFGTWRDDVMEVRPNPEIYGNALHSEVPRNSSVLASPAFTLKAGQLVTFTFSATFSGGADYSFQIIQYRRHILRSRRARLVDSRLFEAL